MLISFDFSYSENFSCGAFLIFLLYSGTRCQRGRGVTVLDVRPFESVCTNVLSMPALTVKKLGTTGSTSTPFDGVLMCVDRHSGYIVAAPTTKEGLTG